MFMLNSPALVARKTSAYFSRSTEIVETLPARKWWIFPSFFVCLPEGKYIITMVYDGLWGIKLFNHNHSCSHMPLTPGVMKFEPLPRLPKPSSSARGARMGGSLLPKLSCVIHSLWYKKRCKITIFYG